MEQTTATKLDSEVDDVGSKLSEIDCLSTALVVAVALHVHHAIEVVIDDVDPDKDALSQTVDLEIWSWECTRHWWLCWWRSCKRKYRK